MKKSAAVLSAMLASATAAHAVGGAATCEYREEPGTATRIEKTKITIIASDPGNGGDVRRETLVVVDVEYQIADFQPKAFRFMASFPTEGLGSMSPLDSRNSPYLESASGKAHLCVPLKEVYDYARTVWPLSMRISMLRETDASGGGSMVGSSSSVKFNALDAPARAAERAGQALPEEYYDALRHTWDFFNNRLERYKACIARFPATQPTFTRVYRTWEGRHRAAIDFVSQLQYDDLMARADGRESMAMKMYDSMTGLNQKYFEAMPEAKLKPQCEMLMEDFADTEDISDSAISDELATLHKYHPESAVEKEK